MSPLPPSSPYITHKIRQICFVYKGRKPRNKKTKGAAENQRNAPLCKAESRKPGFLDNKSSVHAPSGIDYASLCSLAGQYDNPIPIRTRFLAPINCFRIPAQHCGLVTDETFQFCDYCEKADIVQTKYCKDRPLTCTPSKWWKDEPFISLVSERSTGYAVFDLLFLVVGIFL